MNLGDNVYPKDPFTLLNLQSLLVIEISQLKKFKIKKKKNPQSCTHFVVLRWVILLHDGHLCEEKTSEVSWLIKEILSNLFL